MIVGGDRDYKSPKKPDYFKVKALAESYAPSPRFDKLTQAFFGFLGASAAINFFCVVADIDYGEQWVTWLAISAIAGTIGFLRGKSQEDAHMHALNRAKEELMANQNEA